MGAVKESWRQAAKRCCQFILQTTWFGACLPNCFHSFHAFLFYWSMGAQFHLPEAMLVQSAKALVIGFDPEDATVAYS
eukprot:563255-Amphidinium_carterae.1